MLRTKSLIAIVLILFSLNACTEADEAQPQTGPWAGDEPADYGEFVEALEAQGVSVEPMGTGDEPLFEDDTAQIVVIDAEDIEDATIHVFSFPDAGARDAAADTITDSGFTVGGRELDWEAQPYYWSLGNMIILYAEGDDEVIAYLTGILGVPINEIPG